MALDPASEIVVARAVAGLPERRRAVALSYDAADETWIAQLRARAQALLDDAACADLVVMIATAGADAQAGALFGEACRVRGVPVTALVIAALDTPDADLSRTLAPLRPIASMLVVAQGADYVDDMLHALRA
ncbi:MAG: hypothetical protein P4L66_01530 [Acetobacteraceae bacterium]|nr:hypothetical protein [Acetobacteraceae bacterium]